MKKTLLPWAVLALLPFAASAQAQNGVTIYGLIDASLSYADDVDGASTRTIDNGAWQSSRLGFRGVEDLGGGLKAIFTLESGFNVDTGVASSTFFGRQSFVGLSGAMGTVTLGRQYDFIYYLADGRVVAGGLESAVSGGPSGVAGAIGALDLHAGGVRYDNSIKWTRNFGGLGVGLMYGLGREKTVEDGTTRMASATLTYRAGGFLGGLAWVKDNYSAAISGNAANEVFVAKATYQIGRWFTFANVASGDSRNSQARHRPVEIGFMYSAMPLWDIGVAVSRAKVTNAAGRRTDSNRLLLGSTYTLSKRTLLYTVAGLSWSGDASVYAGFVGAPGGAAAPASGATQRVLRAGIRHTF